MLSSAHVSFGLGGLPSTSMCDLLVHVTFSFEHFSASSNIPSFVLIVYFLSNNMLPTSFGLRDGFDSIECFTATAICTRSYNTIQPLQ